MPPVTQPRVEDPQLFRGKTVAILASHGVEESEITFPYRYLLDRGAKVDILVPGWTPEGIITSRFLKPSLFVKASGTFAKPASARYDLIVLTGGAWNAQVVRTDNDALELVRRQYQSGGRLAAICAGTTVLINAGLAEGLTMTGSPPVRLDLENAGADYHDVPAILSGQILTGRAPNDLVEFVERIREQLTGR